MIHSCTVQKHLNYMDIDTRSAFTDGFLLTLINHVGTLQGMWGHWVALIRIDGVPICWQCLSWSILWIVHISVTYWEHSTVVCVLMAGRTCLQLAHPPPYTWHPWYYGCYEETTSNTSNEYCVAELATCATLATYKTALLI